MVVKDHAVYNRDSHLAFDIYEKGSLRVGIQGRQRGTIVDLGSGEDLEKRYGYRDTGGRPQGFASIHREAGELVILRALYTREFQPLREAALLAGKAEGAESTPVVPGHIYLARIVEGETEIVLAKLRVLAFEPGQFVTIRWERL